MTREQAERLNIGDTITFRGIERTILSVKVRGIAAPYFRFTGPDGGLTSYSICGLPAGDGNSGDKATAGAR